MYQPIGKHLSKVFAGCLIALVVGLVGVLPSQAQTSLTSVVEAEDERVASHGAWTLQESSQASGSSYLYSTGSTEDVLTLNFEGSSVEIIYVTHPNFGDFAIDIDNNIRRTVDTTSEATTFDNRAVIDYLEDGEHTLRVYAVEGVIAIDAFVVTEAQPAAVELDVDVSSVPVEEAPSDSRSEVAPGTIVLQQPIGGVNYAYTPAVYRWMHQTRVEWYQLIVVDPNNEVIIDEWLEVAGSSCEFASNICILVTDEHQVNGQHRWYVRGYNAEGLGPFSEGHYVQTAGIVAPIELAQQSPISNATTTARPRFLWRGDRWGEWYNIQVINDDGALVVDRWISYEEALCVEPSRGDPLLGTQVSRSPGELW